MKMRHLHQQFSPLIRDREIRNSNTRLPTPGTAFSLGAGTRWSQIPTAKRGNGASDTGCGIQSCSKGLFL